MSGPRLTEQLTLAFTSAEEDIPSTVGGEGAEPIVAKCEPERCGRGAGPGGGRADGSDNRVFG